MKLLFLVFLIGAQSFTLYAADSEWLVCNDGFLAVNFFEYRPSGGDGNEREAVLTLLYGAHNLQGLLTEDKSDAINLLGTPEQIETNVPGEVIVFTDSFIGTAKVDYSNKTLSLKGNLNLYGGDYIIDSILTCKEMGRL
jgi:hypothetical protein